MPNSDDVSKAESTRKGLICEDPPPGEAGSVLIILTVTLPTVISIVFNPIFGALLDSRGGFVLYVISFIGYAFSAVWYALAVRKKAAVCGDR